MIGVALMLAPAVALYGWAAKILRKETI